MGFSLSVCICFEEFDFFYLATTSIEIYLYMYKKLFLKVKLDSNIDTVHANNYTVKLLSPLIIHMLI